MRDLRIEQRNQWIANARIFKETWADDAGTWYYYNEATGEWWEILLGGMLLLTFVVGHVAAVYLESFQLRSIAYLNFSGTCVLSVTSILYCTCPTYMHTCY